MNGTLSTCQDAHYVLDALPEACVRLDGEFRFRFVSGAAESLSARSRAELLGGVIWEVEPAFAGAPFQANCRRAMTERVQVTFESYLESQQRWYEVTATPDSGGGLVLRFEDATARKAAQDELRRSQDRIRLLAHTLQCACECISITDTEDRILYVNDAFLRTYGYTQEELIGRHIGIVRSGRTPPAITDEILPATMAGNWCGQLWNRTKQGREFPISLATSAVYDDEGRRIALVGIARDITESNRAEEALKESEDNFRTFFESITDMVVVASPEGRILYANAATINTLGYSSGELAAMHVLDLNSLETRREAESIFAAMLRGDRETCPLPAASKDGRIVPVETRAWRGRWNGAECIFGISKNLTAEQEAKQRFERLFRHNPAPVALTSLPDRRLVDVNDAWLNVLGYSRDEVIGRTPYELNLFVHAEQTKAIAERLQSEGCVTDCELQVRQKDGSIRHGLFSGDVISSQGKRYCQTVMIDITERKQAEARLSLQALVLNQIADRVTVTDLDGIITYVNDAEVRALGYPREELIGASVEKYGEDPERGATQREIVKETLRNGHWRGVVANQTSDGREVIMDCRTQVVRDELGKAVALCGIATDVTERIRAEEAVRESEGRAVRQRAAIAQLALDKHMAGDDLAGTLDRITQVLSATLGVARASVWRFSGDRSEAQCLALYDAAKKTHSRGAIVDTRSCPHYFEAITTDSRISAEDARTDPRTNELKDSYTIPFGITSALDAGILMEGQLVGVVSLEHIGAMRKWQPDEEAFAGTAASMVAQLFECVDRKRAEEALRESALMLSRSEEIAHIGSWEYEVAANRLNWSNETYRIFGLEPQEFDATYEAFLAVVHPEDRAAVDAAYSGSLREDKDGYEIDHRVVRPRTGEVRDVREKCVHERDAAGAIVRSVGMVHDITERKRAEEDRQKLQAQLVQAQKMESIGRLSGGVAHDFNNLLTVINGYSQLIQVKLADRDPLRTQVAQIQKAGERAAGLTRQLLAFSRKQVLEPRTLDLNRVVEEMRPMLERLVGEDVEVRVTLNGKRGLVRADPHQLEQVIMNLAVNARDAMPSGGTLSIGTDIAVCNESHARLNPEARAGSFVLMTVSDTGMGMGDETRQRIFEPFFTTKELGQGTGLGLAMVQGIVAQSGGWTEVHSELGRGTTFRIYLPEAAGEVIGGSGPAAVSSLRGKETVLIVEDQTDVRGYAAAVLKSYGYRVIAAENAGEALLLFERERGRVDLILTDVVMPNVSGRELAGRFEKLRPGIKVLFMSGYSDNVIEQHGVLEEGTHFIQKPFSPEALARKIRELLVPLADMT